MDRSPSDWYPCWVVFGQMRFHELLHIAGAEIDNIGRKADAREITSLHVLH